MLTHTLAVLAGSTCSITIPHCLIRVTTEAPDPAQHKPTYRGSLRYSLCSEQGWLKCRQIVFCYLTYRGSDLQHRAGQTAGSGDVKPDRQDSLETLCQRQILDFIFNFFLTLLEFVNLRQLSQKSHCSPGKSSYQLQLTSGKFSQVFQAILGAVATGMCHVHLNYLQGWI